MRDDQKGGDDQAREQKHAGGGQGAGDGVDDRGDEDQERELDRVNDAVQLECSSEAPGAAVWAWVNADPPIRLSSHGLQYLRSSQAQMGSAVPLIAAQ